MAGPSLAEKVAAILQDVSLARLINFSVCRIWVSHYDLCKVGNAILKGRIHVVLNKGYTSGAYNPKNDTFKIPDDDLTSPSCRAVIVHEGVHAANDMCGRKLMRIDDETAAYLAHFLYLRAFDSRFSGGVIPEADGTAHGNITTLLLQLADQLMGGIALSASQVTELQNHIMQLGGYENSRRLKINHNGLLRP